MAVRCSKFKRQFMLLIGIFLVLTVILQIVPSFYEAQNNIVTAMKFPQFESRLLSNKSFTVVKRLKDPVSLWKVHPSDDRILLQAKFNPKIDLSLSPKRILLEQGLAGWNVKGGKQTFNDHDCPVQHCELHGHPNGEVFDARIFKEIELYSRLLQGAQAEVPRHSDQVWIMFALESPEASPSYEGLNDVINWTATYRYDSTMVTPYDKFQVYDNFTQISNYKSDKNYAQGKTKLAAIFVSNCYASNARLEYVKELQQYMDLDFYGSCGNLRCDKGFGNNCFENLQKEYKFYLSFENANCRDYITEKFFLNALRHDVVPVVMGAHPDDYRRVAPPGSFIHVEEYPNAEALAGHLKRLNELDDEYNDYFRWKSTGQFVDTKLWCRICSLLWDTDLPHQLIHDLEQWWRGDNICIGKGRWDEISNSSKLHVRK
ncbi:FUCTA-like protein [Mya arenaria]|uniref:Fucosyltransferase n=1 Tax=Mya arenaria TaxID=6604 RepID=A0ABY7G324_MYAAR|nr:glycoprotein 3-alpha-L-fucosyltransferase A-like [Mya arenaria]XP_052783348.1 glycoprotein 3-alpha-L-fucosyltransferase A-like [Mya arenaria]WAR27717.1 FUCTA-like protein [Mya arenaria]